MAKIKNTILKNSQSISYRYKVIKISFIIIKIGIL